MFGKKKHEDEKPEAAATVEEVRTSAPPLEVLTCQHEWATHANVDRCRYCGEPRAEEAK